MRDANANFVNRDRALWNLLGGVVVGVGGRFAPKHSRRVDRERSTSGRREVNRADGCPTEDLIGCVSCEDRVGCPIMLTTPPQGIANTIMVLIELRRRTRCSAPEFNLSGD